MACAGRFVWGGQVALFSRAFQTGKDDDQHCVCGWEGKEESDVYEEDEGMGVGCTES